MKFKKVMCLCIFALALCAHNIFAQDTIKITIQQAETQFLERNLQLLAERCNIDVEKANLLQAKLFNNPTFSAGINIYNPENRRWFDVGKNSGQYVFAIEQVIRLGGQRNKEIALAKIDVQLSENQFYDLLRTLRFSLGSTFYEAYFTYRSLCAFDAQIALLEELENHYKELKNRGVVPLSDLVRIQSLLYGLRSDKLELQTAFNDLQAQLQLLLQDNQFVFMPEIDSTLLSFENLTGLGSLIKAALENRIDLKTAKDELAWQQKKVSLEKANAVPNITLGADFDRRSGAFDNQFSLNVGIDLLLFNRNKGNINAAKAIVKQKETLVQLKQTEIENEVLKSYANALDADRASSLIDADFEQNLQLLLQSITDNFRKKNISMLEFTDFYESYRDNIIKINQIKNKKAQTMQELQFVVGIDFNFKN
ncbi:MAG: TolC family protein [Prevotellaceae bacterium]|jgi:cobalt-zinc-cadmium efflux system outer membrane protein|nr:TolC family protein [Prevotellaceae bacterium]